MITEPLTKEERERRLKRKARQLHYGRLLTEAFAKGQLQEMLEKLKLMEDQSAREANDKTPETQTGHEETQLAES